MRDAPTSELAELLLRLRLAGPRQLAQVRRRVAAMAGPLPHFDSLWLDALRQAGWLSPFQSQELAAGRGSALAIDRQIITKPLNHWNGAARYRAYPQTESIAPLRKRTENLIIVARATEPAQSEMLRRLRTFSDGANLFPELADTFPHSFGSAAGRVWMRFANPQGECLADVLREQGRLPPRVAWQIYRQIGAQLAICESRGLLHGDVHARNVWLRRDGSARLHFGGIRSVLEAAYERHATNQTLELQRQTSPEDMESLAPELVCAEGRRGVATEIFAFGCFGWQLLTGRPAVRGTDAAAKRQLLKNWAASPVGRLAPDSSPIMMEIIDRCLQADAAERPNAFAHLAELLGATAVQGDPQVARYLRNPNSWLLPRSRIKSTNPVWKTLLAEGLTLAICVLVVLAGWRWFAPGERPTIAANPPAALAPPFAAENAAPLATTFAVRPNPVALANYEATGSVSTRATRTPQRAILRLPVDGATVLDSVALRPRHIVCSERAAQGECAVVLVPPEGILVDVPDVQFRNIVFVAAAVSADETPASADEIPMRPLLRLRAPAARFENCLFLAAGETPPVAAIVWESGDDDAAQFDPVGDRLTLDRCYLSNVRAVVDRLRRGDAQLEMTDVLCANAGTILHAAFPDRAQNVDLKIVRLTQRSGGALLSLTDVPGSRSAGKMRIDAEESLFAPDATAALVEIPLLSVDRELPALTWQGSGSLTLPDTQIMEFRDGKERADYPRGETATERTKLEISGLARANFEFESDNLAEPHSSRVRRIVGPRKSLSPPGVSEAVLRDFSAWLQAATRRQN